jgi:predicted nucleotidyltransferase component of viral defense system
MIDLKYQRQVELLLQVIPFIAKENDFALKGGTAINLFLRDMPRLSVDIDLTYIAFDERSIALQKIEEGLKRIKSDIEKYLLGVKVHTVSLNDESDVKLNVQGKNAQIKIEVNTTTRGIIYPTDLRQVCDSVQNKFDKFAAINVVSLAELYGGKICAAVDRQHPRDIFDVKLLLENEGITDNVWNGFLVGLISHYKPISELLNPILKDQESAFKNQFSGMTTIPFSYGNYIEVRDRLIRQIQGKLSQENKEFLLSFESGEPKWNLFPVKKAEDLSAIKWKLMNIKKFKKHNSLKHEQMKKDLEECFKRC